MQNIRDEIADVLRGRLLRGLNAGALRVGERLPSARELCAEFGGVDHRVVLDAYKILEAEGLIELRPRGGIYVAAQPWRGAVPVPSAAWLTEIITQAHAREIPIPEFGLWLLQSMTTRRIRCVAVQGTVDQIAGLSRELRDDFGLDATGIDVQVLQKLGANAPVLRHADVLVTTAGFASHVRPIADALGKRLIVVDVRPDLIGGQWRLLLRQPVHIVARDRRFIDLLRRFFANTPGGENIVYHLPEAASLHAIPHDATVYVTRAARDALGAMSLRGRVLPAARLFSAGSARELVRYIVDTNLKALTG